MKRYRILIAAALFLAAGAAAAEIVLYENENFNGRRFATGGSVPNLQYGGFNDLASSVIVRSGSWQLCSEGGRQGQSEDSSDVPGVASGIRQQVLCDERKRRLRAGVSDDDLE